MQSVALTRDGQVVVWGLTNFGQANVPPNLHGLVTVQAGASQVLALGGNLPPVASPQAVSGYVNHDVTIALAAMDANGDLLSFHISALPTQGVLYQYADGERGPLIAGTHEAVTDGAGRILFAPTPGEYGSPYDTFEMLAHDGTDDSPGAEIRVNVNLPGPARLDPTNSGLVSLGVPSVESRSSAISPDGAFGFSFGGYPGLPYQIWASTNLVDWESLGPAQSVSNGWFQFLDEDAADWPHRFYRIRMPSSAAYQLNFAGTPNAAYSVWASTNLIGWDLLGLATPTSNGWYQIMDWEAGRWPQRFYRATAP
jgi:hypothetical protein